MKIVIVESVTRRSSTDSCGDDGFANKGSCLVGLMTNGIANAGSRIENSFERRPEFRTDYRKDKL